MNRLAIGVGALVVGLSIANAAYDLQRGIHHWDRLGPLSVGADVPEFEVAMLDGGQFSRGDLDGKVSVVTFWATWCGVCSTEMGVLTDLQQSYAQQSDVQILAVNHEGGGLAPAAARPRVAAYRRNRDLSLPVGLDDGSLSRAFRVGAIPHTVLFDRRGKLRFVHQGRVGESTLTDEIDTLLAE